MSERDEERGFVVVDKRTSAGAASEEPAGSTSGATSERVLTVDFSMLIASFATGALYHLGFAADPETGRAGNLDLPLARQNIEILALIEEKTRGNLAADEAQLLENLLYEVRMRFVEASKTTG